MIRIVKVFLVLGLLVTMLSHSYSEGIMKTGLFKVDEARKEILSIEAKRLKLNLVSVTTDQPIYWPNEEVFVKVVMPLNGNDEVKITVQKKDATPIVTLTKKLNEAGILVLPVLSGKQNKLEVGQYRVDVRSSDNSLKGYATFSVVEGALGALSFAYDFEEISDPTKLGQAKGAWFVGNPGGMGKRWGNFLYVKNELRVMNQPYNGMVTVKSRCYLPGCNGVEAGPSVTMPVKDGQLEVYLDIRGHSGPFEIEVITPKGNLRHMFARSGHVERENILLSWGMTNEFAGTLAPYENTTLIYGRSIYVAKQSENKEDAFYLPSVICDGSGKMPIQVHKAVENPRAFVLLPDQKGEGKVQEISLPRRLKKGAVLEVPCYPPFMLVGVGGFLSDSWKFTQGWALIFTEASVTVEVSTPPAEKPLSEIDVTIQVKDRVTGQGVSGYGILEVYDNRVPSKTPLDALFSSIGDEVRRASAHLASYRDLTGIPEMSLKGVGAMGVGTPRAGATVFAPPENPLLKMAGTVKTRREISGETPMEGSVEEVSETIREGEKKVVYCDVVKTDDFGNAVVKVQLPPQMGRINARFAFVKGFDFVEKTSKTDSRKDTGVELEIMPILTKGSVLSARATVTNHLPDNVILRVSGGGIEKPQEFEVASGIHEIVFEMKGENYGQLSAVLVDKNGKILDKRRLEVRDAGTMPVTFSDVHISDGTAMVLEKGRRVAIYQHPARLLQGALSNINTTMKSWFGHAEAISARCAVSAIVLRGIEEKILDDEGLAQEFETMLDKGIKDLSEAFFDRQSGLIRPYPGIAPSPLWSAWVHRNLLTAIRNIEATKEVSKRIKRLKEAKEMVVAIEDSLRSKGLSLTEEALYDPSTGHDLFPVIIDGKVVYRAVTDDVVTKWYVDKVGELLETPACDKELRATCGKKYDLGRFLKAFERTGRLYVLLSVANALYKKDRSEFFSVFNTIAKGLIATQEPGLLQGPALLGGVYSAPHTLVKFVELLLELAKDKRIAFSPEVEIQKDGKVERVMVLDTPIIVEAQNQDMTLYAPQFVTVRADVTKELSIYDYLERKPFFRVKVSKKDLVVGEGTDIIVDLPKGHDPTQYYAIILLPSNLSARQTEDLLADYRGSLLYGQKSEGGERIQILQVPFRGSSRLVIKAEATMKGQSKGFIVVRHINNEEVIATVDTGVVIVK